jgi:hypothetical protein
VKITFGWSSIAGIKGGSSLLNRLPAVARMEEEVKGPRSAGVRVERGSEKNVIR